MGEQVGKLLGKLGHALSTQDGLLGEVADRVLGNLHSKLVNPTLAWSLCGTAEPRSAASSRVSSAVEPILADALASHGLAQLLLAYLNERAVHVDHSLITKALEIISVCARSSPANLDRVQRYVTLRFLHNIILSFC
jgi:hypothetical protein